MMAPTHSQMNLMIVLDTFKSHHQAESFDHTKVASSNVKNCLLSLAVKKSNTILKSTATTKSLRVGVNLISRKLVMGPKAKVKSNLFQNQ